MTQLPRPNFLLIGAMKSGTTTVYEDLRRHPDFGFPAVKEPARLQQPEVLTPEGRDSYFDLFKDLGDKAFIGDASPQYTFAPGFPDTPRHAKELLGHDIRLAYILRDPITRALSHHNHIYRRGGCGPDFVIENREHQIYENYSKYGMQLELWLEVFPMEQIMLLKFEDYVEQRLETARRLCTFIGADAALLRAEASGKHNVGAGLHPPAFLDKVLNAVPPIRSLVKKAAAKDPLGLVSKARSMTFRAPPDPPRRPGRTELSRLAEVFERDGELLRKLAGDAAPRWDLGRTVAKLSDQK